MKHLTKDKLILEYNNAYKFFYYYNINKYYVIFCVCTGTYFVNEINSKGFCDFRELSKKKYLWFYNKINFINFMDAINYVLENQSIQSVMEFNNKEEFIEYLKDCNKGHVKEILKYL